jgi:hypothetical protein
METAESLEDFSWGFFCEYWWDTDLTEASQHRFKQIFE